MQDARLASANLSGADTRGARDIDTGPAFTRNTILSDGLIEGVDLNANEKLVVRNYHGDATRELAPIPIAVNEHMAVDAGGVLQMRLDADQWESTMSFEHGIGVDLHGSLELIFAADVDPASQIGRRFDLFDWWGADRVGTFQIVSPYLWDLSRLYSSGEITLLSASAHPLYSAAALPEPSSSVLVCIGFVGFALVRRRRAYSKQFLSKRK
jgi:hypothetical protein